jgi:SAM-dependent MidA family methyltransferase
MNELETLIFDELKKNNNKITFHKYMDMALYHPNLGYYQKDNPFGIQGSFYTSVDASDSFGNTLARSYKDIMETLELDYHLCEMGAGSGMLANDILNYLKENEPEFYKKFKYTIIEKSEHLIKRQQEILAPHKDKLNWISFDDLQNFNGVFHSNELVDAFPVHRVINIKGELKEIFVINYNGKLELYPDEFSTEKLQKYIDEMDIKIIENQIIDINLDAISWIESLAEKIDKAIVVTIDYGYPADQLYASFRMDGTLCCYYNHRQNNDYFKNIGEQDLTAFVDFTALEKHGKLKGLEKIAFMQQWLFLVQSGILEEIQKAETDLHKSSIKSLIMPEGGFGTTFHVLIQSKGINVPDNFKHKKSSTETLMDLAKALEN